MSCHVGGGIKSFNTPKNLGQGNRGYLNRSLDLKKRWTTTPVPIAGSTPNTAPEIQPQGDTITEDTVISHAPAPPEAQG